MLTCSRRKAREQPSVGAQPVAWASAEQKFHIALVLEMSELCDRNSPEDEPDAMVANSSEMEGCIERALEQSGLMIAASAAAPGSPDFASRLTGAAGLLAGAGHRDSAAAVLEARAALTRESTPAKVEAWMHRQSEALLHEESKDMCDTRRNCSIWMPLGEIQR